MAGWQMESSPQPSWQASCRHHAGNCRTPHKGKNTRLPHTHPRVQYTSTALKTPSAPLSRVPRHFDHQKMVLVFWFRVYSQCYGGGGGVT